MGKDFLNGDFSFKNWFRIMWDNNYIQIFLTALITNILFLIFPDVAGDGQVFVVVFLSIIKLVVAYKGFYQKWNDLKNGRSR